MQVPVTQPLSPGQGGRSARNPVRPAAPRVVRVIMTIAAVCLICGPIQAQHPLEEVPAGFQWTYTLEQARQVAENEGKIIMLVPAAYRSRSDNPVLSPATESLRAGPLADQRVIRLIRRRFVPCYFETKPQGALYDKQATELAMLVSPELRFAAVMPTPPLMFVTPEGKSLATANVFCTADELYAVLVRVVGENEPWSSLSDDELLLPGTVDQARVLHELGQSGQALKMLGDDPSSAASFLRGVIAREEGDWAGMKRAFSRVTDDAWLNEMKMQELYRHWTAGNWRGIKSVAADIDPDWPRYQEALYYQGLACHYTDTTSETMRLWKESIEANPATVWSLRMDWTRSILKHGVGTPVLPGHRTDSLLGRSYLSPHGNVDLMRGNR